MPVWFRDILISLVLLVPGGILALLVSIGLCWGFGKLLGRLLKK